MTSRSNESLEQLRESALDAILIVDRSGIVLRANARALTVFGLSRHQLIGFPLRRVLPTLALFDQVDSTLESMTRIVNAAEIGGALSGRTSRSLDVRVSPLGIGNDSPILVLARETIDGAEDASRPASERHKRVELAGDIGSMAAGIAHDLNSWLLVIVGSTTLALDALPSNDAVRGDIEEARQAAQHAAALTRRLLSMGRVQPVCETDIDVSATITAAGKLLKRLAGSDVELSILPNATGSVLLDPIQLDQILLNLTANARDAMPHGGQLTIETCNVDVTTATDDAMAAGPYIKLTVTDTGCGMNYATQARIFEPLFTTKAPGKGTGLGLSTVSAIVSRIGGAIRLHSEVGKGTRFEVYLPRSDQEPKRSHSVDAGERAGRRSA